MKLNPVQYALKFMTYLGMLFVIVFFSGQLSYNYHDAGMALMKPGFSHAGERNIVLDFRKESGGFIFL